MLFEVGEEEVVDRVGCKVLAHQVGVAPAARNGGKQCRHLLRRGAQFVTAAGRDGAFGDEALPLGSEIAALGMLDGQLLILRLGDCEAGQNQGRNAKHSRNPRVPDMNSSERS